MNWLESLIYGFISGISEFMPVSSGAHQQILLHLFGVAERDPVRDLFVRIAMLISLIISNRNFLDLVKRERALRGFGKKYARRNVGVWCDWRFIQGAVIPMLLVMFFVHFAFDLESTLIVTSLFLILNGLILFIPDRLLQGNKDARSMSLLDSILVGCAGAVASFSGLSRLGCTYSLSLARGAQRRQALAWALLLGIYALGALCVIDIISIFIYGSVNFWSNLYTYILSGLTAYLGSSIGIMAIRYFVVRHSNNAFVYYCWGMALFSVILYLTVA